MPRKTTKTTDNSTATRPALSPESREQQMIGLAVDLAEQQLRDGTASSQVITHYLKLGSTREKLEREILAKQAELYSAKTDSYKSAQHYEAIVADAMAAMKRYSPNQGDDE